VVLEHLQQLPAGQRDQRGVEVGVVDVTVVAELVEAAAHLREGGDQHAPGLRRRPRTAERDPDVVLIVPRAYDIASGADVRRRHGAAHRRGPRGP
jgi:hypothetical protein